MATDKCAICLLVHQPETVTCFNTVKHALAALVKAIGQPGECRGCGARIFWIRHANGKSVPYTPAGLNHFIDCPVAGDFARKKKYEPEPGTEP